MSYIHERNGWPKLTWDERALAGVLAAVRHKQGRHIGRIEALGFEARSEASLIVLTDETVKSSAIEGEQLDPQEVRSSLAQQLGLESAGTPRPSRDVEGVVEMMLDATQHYDAPLTAARLQDWHAALFPTGRSGMRSITVGAWRPAEAGAMRVVSGRIGGERIHFEAPGAERLDEEMTHFLEWFNSPDAIDPVLKAGVAHFWFVTIHPFEDGNGRIARAIAELALARADGTRERFYSMSSGIEAERRRYYQELETAQRGDLDITQWLTWFLGCLDRTIDRAEQTLATVFHKSRVWERLNQRPVHERQRKVINRMFDNFEGHLNTSKYAKLAKCSSDTALRDIQDLLERGVIVQNPGGGRSTSYRLAGLEELLG